ncbi:unnamed protein product [Closterium sp. NIES-64]|nr:unnamed protein product [Closterium sp. NIES-64]
MTPNVGLASSAITLGSMLLTALNIILASIHTSLKREIRPTTSATFWKDLTTRFDRQDLNSLLSLYREFQALSFDSSPNAATFTRRLTDNARRLTDRGITITDSLLMARILDGLPPAYTTYKIAFITTRPGTPSSSDIITWLLDAEADLLHTSLSTVALARGEVAVVVASLVAMGEGALPDEAVFRDAVVVALVLAPLEVVVEVVVVVALLELAPSLRASTSFVTALSEDNAASR